MRDVVYWLFLDCSTHTYICGEIVVVIILLKERTRIFVCVQTIISIAISAYYWLYSKNREEE